MRCQKTGDLQCMHGLCACSVEGMRSELRRPLASKAFAGEGEELERKFLFLGVSLHPDSVESILLQCQGNRGESEFRNQRAHSMPSGTQAALPHGSGRPMPIRPLPGEGEKKRPKLFFPALTLSSIYRMSISFCCWAFRVGGQVRNQGASPCQTTVPRRAVHHAG